MTPSKPPMGINVASDTKAGLRYADMIVDGHKTLESRNSDTLRPYVGKRVAIVRTGEGKAKAIGEVTVGEPKVVNQKQFRAMEDEHRVPKGSRFDINTPTKHLYPMHDPVRYEEERDVGHGIVSRQVIHKAGGGSVEPTVDEMRQALANKGSKDDYFSVLEERDMSNPRYREYLEKQQGLEGSYPDMELAGLGIGALLRQGKNIAKGLFQPKAPMTSAQKDANLASFLAESKAPPTLYHGTDKSFPAFDKKKVNRTGWGEGFHLAEDTSLANMYAGRSTGSNVMPVHASIKNPYVMKSLDEWFDKVPGKTDAQKTAWAKSKGYDGIKYPHSEPTANETGMAWVAFEPTQIKSAIGNRGTFNPNKANMNKADGGTIHMAKGGIISQLRKNGQGVPSELEAMRRMSQGHRVFVTHEQDETPREIKSVSELHAYTPDQMYTLAPQGKATGGTIHMAKGGSVAKEPKSTVKAYKMFRVDPKQPGKLFPLFVDAKTPVPMNKWVDAKEGEMKDGKVKSKIGPLAYRPGWHAGDLPIATHIGDKDNEQKAEIARIKVLRDAMLNDIGNDKEGKKIVNKMYPFPSWVNAPRLRNPRHIWAEVDMPNDVDWHSEATRRGYNDEGNFVANQAHITDQMPKGGHYRYKTNSNMTGNWLIGGGMRVNRILPDEEVQRINEAAGAADLPRIKPMKKEMFGFAHGGSVGDEETIAPDEWKAEEYVNHKAKGGEVNLFDYENPKHVQNVAGVVARHRDFSQIPNATKHLADALSQGSYKFIEDPRIQSAIKQAGFSGHYINGKDGKQQIIRKAEGGAVLPIEQIKAQMMNRFKGLNQLQSIGANEAPSMGIKAYVPTIGRSDNGKMPVGGVDMSQQQQGQQLMPNAPPAPAGAQPGMDQVPRGDKINTMDGTGMPPTPNSNPNQMGSNILQMTPQGQAMAAMKPQGLAKGGSAKSIDEMKTELAANKNTSTEKRVTVAAPGAGGVKGIVVPKHLIEGNPKASAEGLKNMMNARAKVYGEEHRDPLNLGQMAKIHKHSLEEHFAKPLKEQKSAEREALNRIRAAKFIKHNKDTLDESEKLDTVEHEHDEEGRSHVGYASKGIAGHALYPKGHGKNMDYKVINTCPGQTEGCGGGKSAEGIVDTKQGTCFAPNAESQYAAAVSRRAGHAIAKHDPAMTRDWIIAHTGSMRNAAGRADKQNKRMLYRPNVVDETDVSSRHVIRHLNEQRKMDDKPPIIANSYGKTNELHDPENGYHVTHSNVGPKVKKGREISENVARDKARVRNTVMAADNQGDFKNEQGNKTPPKGSYMVTDVKRGSPMAKSMEKSITHAKYWSTGRPESELSKEEREEGPEGHFGGTGRRTSEDKAHYGHTTIEGLRYDYQKQHILHPRLVQVGKNDDGTAHMIPTDSRFKDTEFLPKNRYKTKNGKKAGHILMTTPTESTSNIGHQTSFTHNVSPEHIEHAEKNNGEYVIDKPEDQAKAKGKEYVAPQAIKFQPKPKAYAMGGSVGGRHIGFSDDDFHAFPEQNVVAQRHLAMRGDDHEPVAKQGLSDHKRKVTMNKDMDTMLLELTRNKKAK